MNLHIIGLLVENRPGVMNRVSGLFSRRGFNIESLSVGVTDDPNISRMTICLKGDRRILEQVKKQLNKQIDVIKVKELEGEMVERVHALIKVNAPDSESRSEIIQIADVFKADIVDISKKTVTIEATGDRREMEVIIEMLESHEIRELARTGTVAMERGKKTFSH